MSMPSRDTPAGRAYLDLQKKARAEGRPTDEMMALYVLAGFLGRLAESEHVDNLVLKDVSTDESRFGAVHRVAANSDLTGVMCLGNPASGALYRPISTEILDELLDGLAPDSSSHHVGDK